MAPSSQLLSELGGPENMIQMDPQEIVGFKEMFTLSSQEMQVRL
jgi:hypothetical protein